MLPPEEVGVGHRCDVHHDPSCGPLPVRYAVGILVQLYGVYYYRGRCLSLSLYIYTNTPPCKIRQTYTVCILQGGIRYVYSVYTDLYIDLACRQAGREGGRGTPVRTGGALDEGGDASGVGCEEAHQAHGHSL